MTPHAVRRYRDRYRRSLSYEQARDELIELSTEARHIKRSHGADLYRLPRRAGRARVIVAPPPEGSRLPTLVTVL